MTNLVAVGLSTLLGHPPRGFESRNVLIPASSERRYVEAEWGDAIVVVARGEVDVELVRGGRRHFRSGAILWLAGLPVRRLSNGGTQDAVLVATRAAPGRATGDDFQPSGRLNG